MIVTFNLARKLCSAQGVGTSQTEHQIPPPADKMDSLASGTPEFESPGMCHELNTLCYPLPALESIPSATGAVAKVVPIACKVPVLQLKPVAFAKSLRLQCKNYTTSLMLF